MYTVSGETFTYGLSQNGLQVPVGARRRHVTNTQSHNQVLFKKWTDYFLFLALVASTRSFTSKETDSEEAVLIDAETLKVWCVHFLKLTILFFKNCLVN